MNENPHPSVWGLSSPSCCMQLARCSPCARALPLAWPPDCACHNPLQELQADEGAVSAHLAALLHLDAPQLDQRLDLIGGRRGGQSGGKALRWALDHGRWPKLLRVLGPLLPMHSACSNGQRTHGVYLLCTTFKHASGR
jgi:hypothetical protein